MERMWTYFLDTSKSREWFPLGMQGFSLGGTKELRRVTQETSMIPIVFHALRKKKNWKQTLFKLSPLSRWQMDVCYFALYTVVLKFLIIEERDEMSVFDTWKEETQKVGGSGRVDSGDQSRRGGNVRV